MRYYEIIHSDLETASQREARLQTMYGKGPSEEEFEVVEMETSQARNEVDRAKALKLRIEALAKLARVDDSGVDDDCTDATPEDVMTRASNRLAIWLRASIVAGRFLPIADASRYGLGSGPPS